MKMKELKGLEVEYGGFVYNIAPSYVKVLKDSIQWEKEGDHFGRGILMQIVAEGLVEDHGVDWVEAQDITYIASGIIKRGEKVGVARRLLRWFKK